MASHIVQSILDQRARQIDLRERQQSLSEQLAIAQRLDKALSAELSAAEKAELATSEAGPEVAAPSKPIATFTDSPVKKP